MPTPHHSSFTMLCWCKTNSVKASKAKNDENVTQQQESYKTLQRTASKSSSKSAKISQFEY